ncbi:MAG: Dihydrolipoyl dehydrogenase [Gammaproteobacteria bacterium]|nr:Dihydrolipoyl dehydrogenase [Gammaproteobacteria bacterium]
MGIEVKVPDIGDFTDVEIIEVLVKEGDNIKPEDPLITLESDKASMDVPAPRGGTIESVLVKVGDKVSEGSPILMLDAASSETDEGNSVCDDPDKEPRSASNSGEEERDDDTDYEREASELESDIHTDVVVLGAGPGGYTAAFRAADLGLSTILVERYSKLGGVCLNVGCIPSKALLHAAEVIAMARGMEAHGIEFSEPSIDLEKLRDWKDNIVQKLTTGLTNLAKQRKVKVIQGKGEFSGPNHLVVDTDDGELAISFENAIIAAGSQSAQLPIFTDHERILDSTSALELPEIPARMLVVGGGIIGLEMATVYSELGTKITVVELTDGLIPGADRDLIKPFERHIKKRYENIYLETEVTKLEAHDYGVSVSFEGKNISETETFDYVLTAIGRTPNGRNIGADNAGVQINEDGFIKVNSQQRTNVSHIFAIGDIVGQPMLAHKATHEGKVAAEACAGHKSHFDAAAIPSVAYTDPEVAWAGITEEQARKDGVNYGKSTFPWAASGRSLGLGRDEGMTKLIFDKDSGRLIGAGVVGPRAGELIAETALAIEMGCDARDIGLTIHPHPTLSESIAFSAEAFEGTITDLYIPKKK